MDNMNAKALAGLAIAAIAVIILIAIIVAYFVWIIAGDLAAGFFRIPEGHVVYAQIIAVLLWISIPGTLDSVRRQSDTCSGRTDGNFGGLWMPFVKGAWCPDGPELATVIKKEGDACIVLTEDGTIKNCRVPGDTLEFRVRQLEEVCAALSFMVTDRAEQKDQTIIGKVRSWLKPKTSR